MPACIVVRRLQNLVMRARCQSPLGVRGHAFDDNVVPALAQVTMPGGTTGHGNAYQDKYGPCPRVW